MRGIQMSARRLRAVMRELAAIGPDLGDQRRIADFIVAVVEHRAKRPTRRDRVLVRAARLPCDSFRAPQVAPIGERAANLAAFVGAGSEPPCT
jgi:hypothetical protein